MRWINTYELQMHEPVQSSQEWGEIQVQLREAIKAIVWPSGSTEFTVNPMKKGNGVPPIKQAFIDTLKLHRLLKNSISLYNEDETPARFSEVSTS